MCTILMSDAQHFNVNYIINPWMKDQINQVSNHTAQQQWNDLKAIICRYTDVTLVPSHSQVPDLVFTANAGTVKDNICILSHFRHAERQAEEPLFKQWFIDHGFKVIEMPDHIFFEGAGDSLFSHNHSILWMGFGFRSDLAASEFITQQLKIRVIPLKLIDPRFYHLDTCFCPMPSGHILYYPQAFNAEAQQRIQAEFPTSKRIPISEQDAITFACNAICLDNNQSADYPYTVVLNDCSSTLQTTLEQHGYEVIKTPTSEFLKSGGATKCLTLKIS